MLKASSHLRRGKPPIEAPDRYRQQLLLTFATAFTCLNAACGQAIFAENWSNLIFVLLTMIITAVAQDHALGAKLYGARILKEVLRKKSELVFIAGSLHEPRVKLSSLYDVLSTKNSVDLLIAIAGVLGAATLLNLLLTPSLGTQILATVFCLGVFTAATHRTILLPVMISAVYLILACMQGGHPKLGVAVSAVLALEILCLKYLELVLTESIQFFDNWRAHFSKLLDRIPWKFATITFLFVILGGVIIPEKKVVASGAKLRKKVTISSQVVNKLSDVNLASDEVGMQIPIVNSGRQKSSNILSRIPYMSWIKDPIDISLPGFDIEKDNEISIDSNSKLVADLNEKNAQTKSGSLRNNRGLLDPNPEQASSDQRGNDANNSISPGDLAEQEGTNGQKTRVHANTAANSSNIGANRSGLIQSNGDSFGSGNTLSNGMTLSNNSISTESRSSNISAAAKKLKKPKIYSKKDLKKILVYLLLCLGVFVVVRYFFKSKRKRNEALAGPSNKRKFYTNPSQAQRIKQQIHKLLRQLDTGQGNLNDLVICSYNGLLSFYQNSGLPKEIYQTPDEYKLIHHQHLPHLGSEIVLVTDIFSKALYGNLLVDQETVQRYIQAVKLLMTDFNFNSSKL
jgi:hypothetical protein